jgi:hypothetical protein
MQSCLKLCFDFKDKDPENTLDFYRAKIHENLAYIYVDIYFYKTPKMHIDKA